MPFATAPALLIGLGARLLLDKLTRGSEEPSMRDFILVGVWQGVALQYSFKHSAFGLPVLIAILGKLFVEFTTAHDITRCAVSALGVVLGFVGTDVVSQFLDQPIDSDKKGKKTHAAPGSGHISKRDRLVQFQRSVEGDRSSERFRNLVRNSVSDITSVDSNSELIGPNPSMTPLDREVAALRARASLADSERRRFKEERKWAESQGNAARASQMKWQVKRYTALMQSFHQEADKKLLEASLNRQNGVATRVPSTSTYRQERPERPERVERPSRSRKEDSSMDTSANQRKLRSSTYKSTGREVR
ncbi:hypothetical protein BD779DRAFT_972039 [Infundibulicybe gibba]|nr:hypothetical protein BD779DRAFT_972039 [Infundibulicybe gibba]